MTFVFMVAVLVFPIVFLLGLVPVVNQIIASLAFAIANIVAIGLLFGSKALIVMNGDDLDFNAGNKAPGDARMSFARQNSRIADVDYTNPNQTKLEFASISEAFKKVKNYDQRAQMCREQMREWERLLMQVEMKDSSASGTTSKNGVSRSGVKSSMGAADEQDHLKEPGDMPLKLPNDLDLVDC